MKQTRLGSNLSTEKARKRESLDEMERGVSWKSADADHRAALTQEQTGRPPFAIETMLRSHDLQQRYGLRDEGLEDALYDSQAMRAGTLVDARIIAAPSSTKNQDGERDPEMHQTKKGNEWPLREEGAHRCGC